jgi:uracil-DNA glycosylase family protein
MQPDLFGTIAPPTAPTSNFIPPSTSIETLREAARACHGCDLYAHATQTVFGEGPQDARLIFVGEQPGDVEDRQGRPFVGPAGKLLRGALVSAGIDPALVYITNAVKHFKFIERGKQRIHASPKRIEIVSCTPWLEAEIRVLQPTLVVALGATAGQALLGPTFRVTQSRGVLTKSEFAQNVIATIHPSSILRADPTVRDEHHRAFVADLRAAREAFERLSVSHPHPGAAGAR